MSETWKLLESITKHLNVFQQRLKQILWVSNRDHINNKEIHRRTATRPLAVIDIILQATFFTYNVEDATPLEVEARMPETSIVAFILRRLTHHRPIMGQSRNHCDRPSPLETA